MTESINNFNSKVIENDYFGMAQDLRRMRRNAITSMNLTNHYLYLPFDWQEYIDSLGEFEDYCLDQAIRITGDLLKQSAKMMIGCEI